jgi:arylsulfatase A-like enzyme
MTFNSRWTSTAFAIVGLFVVWAGVPVFAQPRPNIVLVMVDDMGYSDLGCYGGEIQTPNLDRLATEGIRFTNFTNCAKCETTRATLLSGRYHTEVTRDLANCITLPEVLELGGYHTMMVGKWHLGGSPLDHGFRRYFGFLNGACNFFTGESKRGGKQFRLDREPFDVPDTGFYCTDSFTDYALQFLDEREASQTDKKKPFFLYVAYNAPHYPLQAPQKDVDKYRGKYLMGWDKLREARLARMKKLDIVAADQKLSTRPEVERFESLTPEQKDHYDLLMATYAGMIDRVDQNLGRLLDKLRALGETDNTLVLFLSDNGACPFQRSQKKTIERGLMPWDPESFWTYDTRWAFACNTPWRKFKQNQHEGGISTPLIAYWPSGMKNPGRLERQRGHLVDLHATFRELSGVAYPSTFKGEAVGSARGISLAPLFREKPRREHAELFYYFNRRKTSLLQGKWKLVDSRELYHLPTDRVESSDLSAQHPDRFERMKARWLTLSTEYSFEAAPDRKTESKTTR